MQSFLSCQDSFAIIFRRKVVIPIISICCLLSSSHLFAQAEGEIEQPGDDPASWANLSEEQFNEATLRNLQRIAWAMHAYSEAHEYKLPPAAISNANLPPEKRLSGLVALLPYLGVKPDYIKDGDATWSKWKADNAAAKKLYDSIDLKKAWDDPANAAAAKTVVSSFVTPSGAPLNDSDGNAVSHFALVRGSGGNGRAGFENGPFPFNDVEVGMVDINDGTVNTLAIGQIHEQLGPWIAAGTSTSRYTFHPSLKHNEPRFGSQYKQSGYFANCDAYCYFLDLGRVPPTSLKWASGRSDGKIIDLEEFRFSNAMEWKKANSKVSP